MGFFFTHISAGNKRAKETLEQGVNLTPCYSVSNVNSEHWLG